MGGVGGRVSAYLRPFLPRPVRTVFPAGLCARSLSFRVSQIINSETRFWQVCYWGRGSVNREHLYPDAALWPDRVLDERVLVERQRHQLCASVICSSAPAIWTPLVPPVCGRTSDDPCRAPCSGVT